MTHPTADEVALHLEGLLAPADEQRVGAHLRACADCAATAADLAAVPEALRTAATAAPPPVPAPVADRIEAALAREAARRTGDEQAAPAAPGEPVVASLEERRARRRRVVGAGLLAASAATVVAVGLGELVRTGGPGDAASGGAQESAVAGDAPGAGERRPKRADLGGGATAAAPEALRERAALGSASASSLAGLVEGVAAAHTPDRARHDRDACVRTALDLTGQPRASVASYAVRLPGPGGAVPGAVVLRPSQAPAAGLVVSCGPRPRVLLRHGLDR